MRRLHKDMNLAMNCLRVFILYRMQLGRVPQSPCQHILKLPHTRDHIFNVVFGVFDQRFSLMADVLRVKKETI